MRLRDLAGKPPLAWHRVGLLTALYFGQGLPFGLQATALPLYLRANGASLRTIGFLGLLSLPWMLKALWAPLVDRYGSSRLGRRKSWILPMQMGLALCCAAAALLPEGDPGLPLLGLVFLMNVFAATQDIAVDALAVDLLGEHELGVGNAAQVVGYKLGMLTSGGLLVWMSGQMGWRGLFAAMAALSLGIFGITALAREPQSEGLKIRLRIKDVLRRLVEAVSHPSSRWLLLFVATYKLGETLVDLMFKPFLVDVGFAPSTLGLWMGTWGALASILGSLTGGLLASRFPLLKTVGVIAALRVLPLGAQTWLAMGTPTAGAVIGVTLAEHFVGGALTTAMFAFMMSRVDRRVSASHYTLLASIEVIGKAPAGPLAGLLTSDAGWSYAQLFLLGTLLSVAFLGLLWPLKRAREVSPLPVP